MSYWDGLTWDGLTATAEKAKITYAIWSIEAKIETQKGNFGVRMFEDMRKTAELFERHTQFNECLDRVNFLESQIQEKESELVELQRADEVDV